MHQSILLSTLLFATASLISAQATQPSTVTESVVGAAAPSATRSTAATPAPPGSGIVAAGAAPAYSASTVSVNIAGGAAARSSTTSAAGASGVANAGGGIVASGAVPAAQGTTISVAVSGTGTGTAASGVAPAGSSATAAAAGGQTVWVVAVGSASNAEIFSPDTINAKPGDVVQFQFYANNHSVASAAFAQPCVPLAQSEPANASTAFWSGFMPTTAMGQLTYSVNVRDTNPVWFYCAQAKHCQAGMVGVINPPSSGQTLDQFKSAAAQAPSNIAPSSSPSGGSSGQIGGSTATTSAAASKSTKNAASKPERNWIDLAPIGFAALLLL